MTRFQPRNSNLLSSKNVSLKKQPVLEKSSTNNRNNNLNDKQSVIEQQLAILEKQHEQILAQAESDKQKILDDARKASLDIEKTAYEEGYSQGLKNGYEDGYKEAYEKRLEEVNEEFNNKIDEATKILLSSKSYISDFVISKKSEILNLALVIAEKVLCKEFENKDSMDAIFEQVLLDVKDKKSLVIKVNPLHKQSMESQIINLKDEFSLTDDIAVIGLSSIDKGNVVIESENGILSVGIDVALENIKSELL